MSDNLSKYLITPNFDEEIASRQTKLTELTTQEQEHKSGQAEILIEQTALNEKLLALSKKKSDEVSAIKESQNSELAEVRTSIVKTESENTFLTAEIAKLEAIKDVCPTCNQKIPDVHTHDTTEQKVLLESKKTQQQTLKTQEREK